MTLRRHVVPLLRRLDRAAGVASGPRRVLVEVRTPMNLEVLRPVWSALAADARVRLSFLGEDERAILPALAAEGLERSIVRPASAMWTRFDLAFNADPWNAVHLRRCWRRLNFFHGVAGKYDLDNPTTLAAHIDFRIYDRVMFPNEDRMRRYVESGVVRPGQAALVGFPKTDALVNGEWDRAGVHSELSLDPGRTTVLYAPTFSPASSLHACGEEIIEALLACDVNVIVKLHDRSLVPHPKFTANVDWRATLARFNGRSGYAFAEGPHAGPYLAAADVLVTDHSTVGFEFALLDRPIVVMDAPGLLEAARIQPERWRQLRSMADVVTSPADLPEAVRRALAERERHARARREISSALFAHAGRATDRALDVVYELLEIERPRAPAEDVRSVRL